MEQGQRRRQGRPENGADPEQLEQSESQAVLGDDPKRDPGEGVQGGEEDEPEEEPAARQRPCGRTRLDIRPRA
jgi:hypothetical protein